MKRIFVTGHSKQTITAFRSAEHALELRGIELSICNVSHWGRRLWRYRHIPIQDLHTIRTLRSEHYDLVVLNPGATVFRRPLLFLVLMWLARRRSTPFVVQWHSSDWLLEELVQRYPRRCRVMAHVLNRKGVNHWAVSPSVANAIQRLFSVNHAEVLDNAVSLPTALDYTRVPGDEPPLIVNVGSVTERKGPDLFVETARQVCRKHPNVKFVWVGPYSDKSLVNSLRQQIEEFNLEFRVEFVGPSFPSYDWLLSSSVIFAPSRSEAFGLAVAEAMACRRTVVCFQDKGCDYVVGETGKVVPAFDVEQAARALLDQLAKTPQDRVNRAARQRYEERFTPEAFAARVEELLTQEGAFRAH